MNQETANSLIAEIYDAALDSERWPKTLEHICSAFGASAVNISVLDGMGLPTNCLTFGIPPEIQTAFLTKYSRPEHNPAAKLAPVETLCRIRQMHDEEWRWFRRTEMYEDLYAPLLIEGQAVGILERSTRFNIGVGLLFRRGNPLQDNDEMHFAQILAMHLQRSLQICLRMELLGKENRLVSETLDKIRSTAVVLVDARGAVILANEAAEELGRQHDGFSISPKGLSAASPDLTRQLTQLIAAAGRTTSGEGLSSGGTIRLSRPSGRRPFLAVVSPVGMAEWSLVPRRPAALVLVCDPERSVQLPPERLASLFGLTRREGQIAALLAEGADLGEAAGQLGISRGTAHTHLKRILEKTDTHRQAELVSLLLRGLAGLGH